MPDKSKLYRYKFDLFAEIGTERFSCNAFMATFPLNGMPTCQLGLSAGRQVKAGALGAGSVVSRPRSSGDALQNATLLSDVEYLSQAKVYFRPFSSQPDETLRWPGLPSGKLLTVFDGLYNGPSFNDGDRQVQHGATLTHWLLPLSFVSGLDKRTFSVSPFSALQPANNTAGSEQKASLVVSVNPQLSAIFQSAGTDLWGSGLVPFIEAFAKAALPPLSIGACFDNVSVDAINERLTYAAQKLQESLSLPSYKPLAIREDSQRTLLAPRFGQFVEAQLGFEQTNETLWDKLIGRILPQMHCHLVVGVDRAFAAPVVFGAGSDPNSIKLIDADSVLKITTSNQVSRPIRGLQLIATTSSTTNSSKVSSGSPLPTYNGCYDSGKTGAILYRAASELFAGLVQKAPANKVFGIANRNTASQTGTNPGSIPDSGVPSPTEQAEASNDVLSNVARLLYYEEALRGRVARVVCPLRLDISPGSLVRVQLPQGTERSGRAAYDLVGVVTKLSVSIDAQSTAATTTLELRNYILLSANGGDLPPIERHPLYGETPFSFTDLTDLS